MKTTWQPLSSPGATGRFLAVRLWDGDINIGTCMMNDDKIEQVSGGAIYDRDDILSLTGTLPEAQTLIEATRRLYDIAYNLTTEKIVQLGDDAMIAAGFGLAYGRVFSSHGRFERIDLRWASEALAPFKDLDK